MKQLTIDIKSSAASRRTECSLEESLHLAQLKLRNLPNRAAIVKRQGKRTVRITTADVKPVLHAPTFVERFRASVAERSNYVTDRAAAEAEIAERQAALLLRPKSTRAPEGADQFWEDE